MLLLELGIRNHTRKSYTLLHNMINHNVLHQLIHFMHKNLFIIKTKNGFTILTSLSLNMKFFTWQERLSIIFCFPWLKDSKNPFNFLYSLCEYGSKNEPKCLWSLFILIIKYETQSCTFHTWVFMPLSNNHSFQNHRETALYSKFKRIDHTQTCNTTYMGVCVI